MMPDVFGAVGQDRARTDQILRRLELTVSHRLDGLLQGDHLGLVPGHGSELGETRAYVAGDDVRRIDWNVTARMQEPYLRSTIADRELETWVVLDRSAGMDFGTARCTKADLGLAAVAAVGFLTAHAGNRIGAVFPDPDGDQVLPPRGGRRHLMRLLHTAATPPAPRGGAVLADSLTRVEAMARRRGLVVVVSDFLTAAPLEAPLARLALRHEVLAVEIVDPRELTLPDVGLLTVSDPASGRSVRVDTSSAGVRERFAAAANAQREQIVALLERSGAEHLRLRTDRDWVLDLVRHVAFRRRRRAAATGALRVGR